MYTPDYSSGYTFNTEFAFNTSVYPYSTGNLAYVLSDNTFSKSIASIFLNNGYSVNSYHEGQGSFYNRAEMHEAFGYERYHSFYNYPEESVSIKDDTFLYRSEELYQDLISEKPFMSFVITFSPHLPYDAEDEMSKYALEQYLEYAQGEITEEDCLRAKARLTDDMFAGILKRLEEDGILDDTVIVGFADHYAYGMTDKERLQELSEAAGNSILENTPAFIYNTELEKPIIVDKVMQTTDLAPTILNMFGFDVPTEIMGSDVFDESYKGYAIFPNSTWITKEAYVKQGQVVYNNGMTEEQINEMNQFVQKAYRMNDYILDTDYYRYLEEEKTAN